MSFNYYCKNTNKKAIYKNWNFQETCDSPLIKLNELLSTKNKLKNFENLENFIKIERNKLEDIKNSLYDCRLFLKQNMKFIEKIEDLRNSQNFPSSKNSCYEKNESNSSFIRLSSWDSREFEKIIQKEDKNWDLSSIQDKYEDFDSNPASPMAKIIPKKAQSIIIDEKNSLKGKNYKKSKFSEIVCKNNQNSSSEKNSENSQEDSLLNMSENYDDYDQEKNLDDIITCHSINTIERKNLKKRRIFVYTDPKKSTYEFCDIDTGKFHSCCKNCQLSSEKSCSTEINIHSKNSIQIIQNLCKNANANRNRLLDSFYCFDNKRFYMRDFSDDENSINLYDTFDYGRYGNDTPNDNESIIINTNIDFIGVNY